MLPIRCRWGASALITAACWCVKAWKKRLRPWTHCRRIRCWPATMKPSLTGTWITAAEATEPAYWAQHVRETVRFAAGLDELVKEPDWMLLEVGPGTTLRTLAQQYPGRDAGQAVLASLPHPHDPRPAMRVMLQTLGQLWSHGSQVDWAGFYAVEQRRRVALPTYPFERQRYWIDAQPATATAPPDLDDKLALNDWFAVPSWKRSKPLICFPQVDLSEQTLSWLIFVDASDLGRQLVQCLQQHGQTVITVTAGEAFHQHDERAYTLNPGQPEAYKTLFKALSGAAQLPSHMVYLWSVTRTEAFGANLIDFYNLLFLAQAVGEATLAEPIHLSVISSGVQVVTGDEQLIPEKATLIGPCRVIPQEYPLLSCRSIDIVWPVSDTPAASQLVRQLLAELRTDAPEAVVAYRGPHRWVQTFEPAALGQRVSRLRHQGVYLLTGGLSDTGLALAHYLAQTVQAKLILVDSATFPDKAQWPTWLHEGETSRKIERLQAIEALGVELLIIHAAVTDPVQLQTAVEQAQQRFGELHGVVHMSSSRGSGLMQLKTTELAQEVLAPRVIGTQILEKVLQDIPLDFLALFGSNVSITGGLGQVDECAAHTFLDAYAHSRGAQAPYQVVAIDWSGWSWDDHFERLMADIPYMQEQAKSLRELYGITPQEAGEALERILSSGEPQIIVSTQDLQGWIDQQNTLTSDRFMEQMEPVQPFQSLSDENFEAPTNETEERIAAVWQEVFGMPRIGRHDNFFDLGGHSLLAIQLVSRTRDALQMDDLPLNRLFETPTVAGLAEFAATRQQTLADSDALAALLQEIEGLSEDEIQAALLEEMQEDE
ncbi:hypothetical protein C2W62_02320 [Candidatus Entotheonella serta]|nr:hypothetical protein C2W62_02320 [Candidatus Entotheonella serta]